MKLTFDELKKPIREGLMGLGLEQKEAEYVAQTIALSAAFGIQTHSLTMLDFIRNQKEINFKARPKVINETDAMIQVDGDEVLGHISFQMGVDAIKNKAKKQGVGVASIANSFWLGAINAHILPIVEEGLVALVFVQSTNCLDCAPYGAIEPRFSTNPIALGFPKQGEPVLADFSTASVAFGKTKLMASKNQMADDYIFIDSSGKPSKDPKDMVNGGSISFTGGTHYGFKGYALSLFCEALSAMGGGHTNNQKVKNRQNYTILVFSPDRFAGSDYFMREMQHLTEHVKSATPIDSISPVMFPGERSFKAYQLALKNGIVLTDEQKLSLENWLFFTSQTL